jgi:hypothetical protein
MRCERAGLNQAIARFYQLLMRHSGNALCDRHLWKIEDHGNDASRTADL